MILREYISKPTLSPQDVIKCYLKVHSINVSPTYDRRVFLWDAEPGDVVYIDGVFLPLLSRFAVDEKDDKRCRKWYAAYRRDSGRPGVFFPEFDGLTAISKSHISHLLSLLRHKDRRILRRHFGVTDSQRKFNLRQAIIDKQPQGRLKRRRQVTDTAININSNTIRSPLPTTRRTRRHFQFRRP